MDHLLEKLQARRLTTAKERPLVGIHETTLQEVFGNQDKQQSFWMLLSSRCSVLFMPSS